MFIVWRKKAITGDRKAELFHEYSTLELRDGEGKTLSPAGVRRKSVERCWAPLWCEHEGEGRLAWTASLVMAERVGGKPRQKLLHKFPVVRSCCAAERGLVCAAWWWLVTDWLRFSEENNDGDVTRFIARDKKAILARLLDVVPRPSRSGLKAFAALREAKEAEEAQYQAEAERAWKRAYEEQERKNREQAGGAHYNYRDGFAGGNARSAAGGFGGSAYYQPVSECWSVLGLKPTATADELQARYRELAKKFHPDRNPGDAEAERRFKEVQAAYEQARLIRTGR